MPRLLFPDPQFHEIDTDNPPTFEPPPCALRRGHAWRAGDNALGYDPDDPPTLAEVVYWVVAGWPFDEPAAEGEGEIDDDDRADYVAWWLAALADPTGGAAAEVDRLTTEQRHERFVQTLLDAARCRPSRVTTLN